MEARNLRKERTGVVVSNKMDKTITVAAKFKEKHPCRESGIRQPALRLSQHADRTQAHLSHREGTLLLLY